MLRLSDRGEGAERHRRDRDEDDDLLPLHDDGRERRRCAARTNIAMAATFGAAAKNAVTGVGAPSYTSGVHIWNGTAETLKQSPANRNTRPKVSPRPPCAAALRDAGKRHRAGKAVNQRAAIEQHARRQAAEDEIFQARFGRAHGVAIDRRRARRATGSSARGRDRARSDRPPRSSCPCRSSPAESGSGYSNRSCFSRAR